VHGHNKYERSLAAGCRRARDVPFFPWGVAPYEGIGTANMYEVGRQDVGAPGMRDRWGRTDFVIMMTKSVRPHLL